MRIVASVVFLALWLGGIPSRAEAQDDARTTAAARALFQEGVTCADHMDWPCAVDRFGSARAMRASPVILLNYAIALSHVGRIVEASEIYRSLSRDASAPAALRTEATHAVTELEPRFGRILLQVTGSLDDVSLTLDGAPVATSMANVAVPGDPGDHVIEAHRGDEVVATARVHVESGETGTTELVVPAPPRVEVASASDAARALDTPRIVTIPVPTPVDHHEVYEEWWFWTILGVAVVGAAVGIGVGVATSSPTTILPSGSLGTIDARP